MRICVTGHRPDKLYGYDLSNWQYMVLKEKLKTILKENGCDEAITGMALGVDTIFALAVLELKMDGYPIKLHCAIPCKNQEKVWRKKDRERYQMILDKADIVTMVTDKPYVASCMQKRNEFMVDLADKVIAVWNGSAGGTKNCVNYAQQRRKIIIRIRPQDEAPLVQVEMKKVYKLMANLIRTDGSEYCHEFQVLGKSSSDAWKLLEIYLSHPEQTGLEFEKVKEIIETGVASVISQKNKN